jgi:type IV secretion system protein TrbL
MWNSTGKEKRIDCLGALPQTPPKGRRPFRIPFRQSSKAIALMFLFVMFFMAAPSGAAEFGTIGAFTQGMLETFRANFQSFEVRIHQAALTLFAALFLCQLAWSVLQLMLMESLTFTSVIATVVRQVMTGMFFYWLLFDRSILKGIVDSFSQLASAKLTFTDLLFFAETAMYNIMTAVQGKGGLSLQGIALFFSGLAASLVLSYALMTAVGYMAIVLLENYIVGSLGLILLGFGGSEYTRNYALSYIKALVHIGFKLFLVSVIIYVGAYSFTKTTYGMVGSDADSLIQTCMTLIGQSFLFVAIIKVIPQIADTLISGVSMNTAAGAHALRSGAAGAAGLAVGTAALAYDMPGRAADAAGGSISAVRSAANAYSANFNAYKSQGLNNVRAGVSALGSTIWEGYQSSRGQHGMRNSMGIKPEAAEDTSKMPKMPETAGTQKSPSEDFQPPQATAAKDASPVSPKDRKATYSAPTPEELSRKFKN